MATSTIRNLPSIVEQGTSGNWTYRKWSDGTAECWGSFTFVTGAFSTWGSWYVGANIFKENYPSGLFIEPPCENISIRNGGSLIPLFVGQATGVGTKDNTAGYVAARGTSSGSIAGTLVSLYAIGKW